MKKSVINKPVTSESYLFIGMAPLMVFVFQSWSKSNSEMMDYILWALLIIFFLGGFVYMLITRRTLLIDESGIHSKEADVSWDDVAECRCAADFNGKFPLYLIIKKTDGSEVREPIQLTTWFDTRDLSRAIERNSGRPLFNADGSKDCAVYQDILFKSSIAAGLIFSLLSYAIGYILDIEIGQFDWKLLAILCIALMNFSHILYIKRWKRHYNYKA